ncbi:hypothetical protein AB1Y20_011716 [Prymnesium parvum]|uniref:CCHC-type domain-containing protein n=1 Tax=Prymnesium parvum TaxID=97485 RepID=A0AB34IKS2_PRYPA
MPTDPENQVENGNNPSELSKPPRPSGNSATSRKNKLQRCSVCGGLGHKSRTCELAAMKMGDGAHALSNLISPGNGDGKDPRTVVAAYGLLTLSESAAPLQPMPISTDRANAHPVSAWLQPSSPRILAT